MRRLIKRASQHYGMLRLGLRNDGNHSLLTDPTERAVTTNLLAITVLYRFMHCAYITRLYST